MKNLILLGLAAGVGYFMYGQWVAQTEKAEAEAAYREASEAWRRIRDGEEPAATESEAPAADEATTETDRTDDDAEDAAGDSPTTADEAGSAAADDSADESE